MNRLVGIGMFAAVVIGCSQTRDRLQQADGLAPAGLPPGLPPIQEQINAGPFPLAPPTAERPRPVRASGFAPGVNGEGMIDPPRLPTAMAERPGTEPSSPTGPSVGANAGPSAPDQASETIVSTPTDPPDSAEAEPETESAIDAEVKVASATVAEPVVGEPVGEWAARVDSDIITWNELQSAVARRMRELDPQTQAAPGVREALAANVLDHLIDRSLVIQGARRAEFKDEKRWELINKAAVEFFMQERLPAMLNQTKAADRYELERMLADRGESLDEIIDSFKLEFVYQQYLMANVTSKIRVDLPELRAYYFENRDHESFHRDAEVTWREIVVRFANHPSREAARAKVEEALARLGKGEPIEEVARALSEGPNAEQGGLWTTAPGTYAVAAVNEAIGTLKPGQTSPIIEGPTGFHVVRLDASRPAGRMGFEEVQDEIRDIIQAQKENDLIDTYLSDLYRGAVVSTVFSEYVPRHLRDDAPQP